MRIKASWAKGGRAREIPIWNEGQRPVLDAARRLAGPGALIPGGRGYAAQRKLYERQAEAAGLSRMHGLRLCAGPLRGPHGLEDARGGLPPAAVARACEAPHRQGGAHDDRTGTRKWQARSPSAQDAGVYCMGSHGGMRRP
ncbi:MAG: integrase domain-containing protein [Gammaproteobacteria bacterium]|nr:integrase domain-containing protein [Gammaproteobacteria bacterium]